MIRIKLGELMAANGRRLKVVDLAEATGIHKNTLYRLYKENGTRVDLDVLERLCDYFNCSLCDLMDYEPGYIRPSAEKMSNE